ncbi:hypothetical protein EJ06DRAFT_558604 [Trichodelitschia bisporula]|uniref:Uncharacterized protein n=1 Tax=Trichodelitschia bisporula TaxID=703511 RepID=A0A6G1HQV7_9PEZI|nr:hypothetical protein EJ06DRAFT_558604 [Trichodelitschia bisporula]
MEDDGVERKSDVVRGKIMRKDRAGSIVAPTAEVVDAPAEQEKEIEKEKEAPVYEPLASTDVGLVAGGVAFAAHACWVMGVVASFVWELL